MELSSWINSLTCEVQKQTTKAKFQTLFHTSEPLHLIPDSQIISRPSAKINDFVEILGLNSYGSDRKLIQKLYLVSKTEIQPILIILSTFKHMF